MTQKSSKRKTIINKNKHPRKNIKKKPIGEKLPKADDIIQPDDLNNTALARQQLWTKTVLEIVLFRGQFPSFLDPDEFGMKTPWKIKVEKECSRLETIIRRAVEFDELKVSDEEIEFRLENLGEPLAEVISDNISSNTTDFYFLLTHKEPGFSPIQILKILRDQEYPIPDGLIDSIEKKRFQDAGKLLWSFHQNMIHWLCSGKMYDSTILPFPIDYNQLKDHGTEDQSINIKRKARKLQTQEMHKSWQKEFRKLKREYPTRTDTWCSEKIAKMDIAQGRNSETIRKNMKK